MTEMSMNKAIHGAFRRDLDRFIDALERFTAGDRGRAQQLGTAWANFDDQLTYHHEGEHKIAWPALKSIGVTDDVIRAMDAEHETMAAALTEARTAMDALRRTAGGAQSTAALTAMRRLKGVTVEHLDHEEAELEELYLSKRESPEMKAMGRQFGKVSPARGGRFFAWVLDGATPDERAAVTGEVPGPVLKIIGGVFGRGYRKNVAGAWRS
jgi:hemerythrin-like domain-containing protein